ncbi:MAG: hypothetical protein PVI86_16695 [Phycisphaerae bacterium]
MDRRTSFALVLVLFLVVLLATTGAGLALTATTESVTAAYVARDLDHRLALESFLLYLPELLERGETSPEPGARSDVRRRLKLAVGDCRVRCLITPEKEKLHLASASQDVAARLRELARAHKLDAANIRLRPIQPREDTETLPQFVWFDQVVEAADFEEIFRWVIPDAGDRTQAESKTWSDLISFWGTGQASALALEIQTKVEADVRRWYGVVSVADDNVRVHWLGKV